MSRIFVLSPANCNGKRAQYLLNPHATFDLGARISQGQSILLGEAFTFMSGLYFRGKLEYAVTFGSPTSDSTSVYIITPNRGLLQATTPVRRGDLLALREGSIRPEEVGYREPLRRDAEALAYRWSGEVVLLGSIVTHKYTDILLEAFGERVVFPVAFAGRGDLSRGGLLLRAARSGTELEYASIQTGVRHGPRPPRLPKWESWR